MKKHIVFLTSLFTYSLIHLFIFTTHAQITNDSTLKVLVVIAHPDDESGASCTIYKITHQIHGIVDIACITNGEAGYKYSTLANDYYGMNLTDPNVGRENLPRIRKQELMNAGKIIGVNNIFFFDQKDDKYGKNPHAPLDTFWNVNYVKQHLRDILMKTNYDYVFCLLPTDSTHGGHKAATICALQTVKDLPQDHKPIILGMGGRTKTDSASMKYASFVQLAEYPITKLKPGAPIYTFDRTQKFGYKNRLDWHIIANWEIAEHKSQGTMQLFINGTDLEDFYYFDINSPAGIEKTRVLFELLKVNPFAELKY